MQKNDPADFIIIDNFNDFNILKTYIDGKLVAENNKSLIAVDKVQTINKFAAEKVLIKDFRIADIGKEVKIISAISGEIITEKLVGRP